MNKFIVFTITVFSFLYTGCNSKPAAHHTGHGVDLYILVDRSEANPQVPEAEEVYHILGIDTNLWAGYRVTFQTIGDVDYQKATVVELPPENQADGNTERRKKQIIRFKARIAEHLQKLGEPVTLKVKNSVIYRIIAGAANTLAESPYRKCLIIYSDLRELNPECNFYTEATLKKIKEQPDEIIQKLEQQKALKDLAGTGVFFVYEAQSAEDNADYRAISQMYERLFTSHHAEVFIGPLSNR
jgi:hypothetical protein